MRITRKRFVNLLNQHRGAEFVSLLIATVPPMNKTGNPYFGQIEQVSRMNGVINWHYEDAVNRQRAREGNEPDFKAFPRSWGIRIQGTPFVEHGNNLYLELKVESTLELWYRYRETHKVIRDDLVDRYIKRSGNSRQMLYKEVVLRDIRLDHILTARYRGNTYILTQ